MSTKALPIPTDPAVALAAIRLVSRGEGSWDKIEELAVKAGKAAKKDKSAKTAEAVVEKVRANRKSKTRSRVESEPAPDQQQVELDNARFRAYTIAYIRLTNGEDVSNLPTDELMDIAVLSKKVPVYDFGEWKARRFGEA